MPLIKVDADKTTWVLNNLLTNAIKYSFTDGTIEVSAMFKNDNVIFAVKDYGQGIAEELAKFALNYARESNLKVIPSCRFVNAYIKRHQEYQDLVWEA